MTLLLLGSAVCSPAARLGAIVPVKSLPQAGEFAPVGSSWEESRHRAKFSNDLILTGKSRVASTVCLSVEF